MEGSTIPGAAFKVQSEPESDSDDSNPTPTLFDPETVINLTPEQVTSCQEKISGNFKSRIDIKTLERPGICYIFPREEFKFESSPEYIESEEYQEFLYKVAHNVYDLKREILADRDLPENYEDKYIKFEYLDDTQLHKYTPVNEEDYVKKGMHLKNKFTLVSEDGKGHTYKMWKTNARLIRSILDLHGFTQTGEFDCSILWTNTVGKRHMFNGFNDYQWINHFPNSYEITRKMDLFKNFTLMRQKHSSKEYNYCPMTFLLPAEKDDFKAHLQSLEESPEHDPNKLWIVKPNKLSRGRGIYLIKEFDQLENDEGIVSEYVDNPLTVNGHKFDLRIYVVVTSFYPLRIYVYREGLARFATEKYSKEASQSNLYVHLTNYSINKKNRSFKGKTKLPDDTLPYKWSLTAFFERLKSCGVDVDLIWEQIYDLIIKSILSSERYISYYTKEKFTKCNRSFEIFGYDVMIDDTLKPVLMEINLSPSLSLESKMDIKLKTKLITEMFNMYGFRKLSTATLKPGTPWDKEKTMPGVLQSQVPKHKCKNYQYVNPELTDDQIDDILEKIEEADFDSEMKAKMTELASSKHFENIIEAVAEYTRKKDYIRIFPSKGSNKYFKFFKYDLDVNKKLYQFLYE